MKVPWAKWWLAHVAAAVVWLGACAGCDSQITAPPAELVVEALPGIDAGVKDEGFTEGFVLCTGPWKVYEAWIVEGDRVMGAWLDLSAQTQGEPRQWRGQSWVLSLAEQQEIRRCLNGLSKKLGFFYMNTRIQDGLRLELYATPDAKGPVVLVSNNAGIKPLDELFTVLNKPMMTGRPREWQVLEDARVVEVLDRAIGSDEKGRASK